MPPISHATWHFQCAVATVVRHPAGYVRIDWHAVPMASAEVRALFAQVLAVLRQEGLRQVLTDRTAVPPLWADDCRWLVREWVPRAVREAGLTHCVVIDDQAVPTPAGPGGPSAEGVAVRYCRSFAAAEAWLRGA